MVHLFKGYLLLSMGTLSTTEAALQCAQDAVNSPNPLTEQEEHHRAALIAWAHGDTEKAVNIWEQIVISAPLDLLALKLHHFALFWVGQPVRMLKVSQQVSASWNEDVPGYANYLGMIAFAHEELGNYEAAESFSRKAIDLNADDLWSLHALAHTFEMQGRIEEGIELLNFPLDQFDDRNPFRGHLWWHLGMFAVEKGDFDRVLDLYDRAIYADQSSFYLDLQNTASILARLEFCGVDVGDRWQPLGEVVKERQGDHVLAFSEPHHTMILARCAAFDEIDQQLKSLSAFSKQASRSISPLIEPVIVPACQSIRDYYRGDYQTSGDALSHLQNRLSELGGSHAQRDLFTLLEIQCALEADDIDSTNTLLLSRLEQRPNSAINWQQYLRFSRQMGDIEKVAEAQSQLDRIANAH